MKKTSPHPSAERSGAHERQMRKRIYEEAFRLMAEKGIDGVSMREIAEKVHVTKPVLYYYFKNKEDLCLAIIWERAQQFNKFLEGALARGLTAPRLLEEVFGRHVEFFQKDPDSSKFIARTIAYALSNPDKFKYKDKPTERLREAFAESSLKKSVTDKGLEDLECLVRAVLLQIMLSAYERIHMLHEGKSKEYDRETVGRLSQIIILGVEAYYHQSDRKN